jgi:hypothetical protein
MKKSFAKVENANFNAIKVRMFVRTMDDYPRLDIPYRPYGLACPGFVV